MNVERFKRAIEIIEATPEKQIELEVWQRAYSSGKCDYINHVEQATCGTIACAAGWLVLDPEMRRQGLVGAYGGEPHYTDGKTFSYYSFSALNHFFGLSGYDADVLFGARTTYELTGDRAILCDKQIWLHRAKTFLSSYEGDV